MYQIAYLELSPNLTPVAVAVWSRMVTSSLHCLHRYTLQYTPVVSLTLLTVLDSEAVSIFYCVRKSVHPSLTLSIFGFNSITKLLIANFCHMFRRRDVGPNSSNKLKSGARKWGLTFGQDFVMYCTMYIYEIFPGEEQ